MHELSLCPHFIYLRSFSFATNKHANPIDGGKDRRLENEFKAQVKKWLKESDAIRVGVGLFMVRVGVRLLMVRVGVRLCMVTVMWMRQKQNSGDTFGLKGFTFILFFTTALYVWV